MKLRILLLFTVFTFGGVFLACQQVDNDMWECPDILPYFSIKSIESINLQPSQSNNNNLEEIEEGEVVLWERFFIRFAFEADYLAQKATTSPNGSLFALSCAPNGWKGDKIGLDTLYVRTLSDFNENFVAGDTINDLILTNYYTNTAQGLMDFTPLVNYIEENHESVKYQVFDMKLSKGPTEEADYAFDLIYVLNDGQFFTHRTDPVHLK
ncbi:hypothetical protein [Echinicola sp. 20G]|uniref:hypothetical protein n=1 Tax=Echinicola sp. 20G TaxID=2781961 RepID=UPI0019101DC0|nr:hypothetical protein [Echinicola sp. 20G]